MLDLALSAVNKYSGCYILTMKMGNSWFNLFFFKSRGSAKIITVIIELKGPEQMFSHQ